MRAGMRVLSLTVGVALLLMGAAAASAQSWSVEQQEIWNFEISQATEALEKERKTGHRPARCYPPPERSRPCPSRAS
ncbi:MAG TPA: hypothetical protein VFM88_16890 [Vicinamibacteria bacterium]|nr:hypothetical protein [Vicinamibacteria bacterium]